MGDRAWAHLMIVGWPEEMTASEGRVSRKADGSPHFEWTEWALYLEPCSDPASYGGSEEWEKLGQVLAEASGQVDRVEFERFETLPSEEEVPPPAFVTHGVLTLACDEVNGGSYFWREESEVPEALRELGLAYLIEGGGYGSEWGQDFEAWRPGWPEPIGGPADPNEGPALPKAQWESLRSEAGAVERYYEAQSLALAWRPWQEEARKLEPPLGFQGSADPTASVLPSKRAEVAGDPRGERDR